MDEIRDRHDEAFETVREWWRAWAEKDLSALERMVDPRYSERTETGQHRPIGIAELMQEASQYCTDCAITDWEIFDPVTKLFERIIVCSYSFRVSGTRGRRSFSFEGHATDVLARGDDTWCYLSHRCELRRQEGLSKF